MVLEDGVAALGLSLPAGSLEKLAAYLDLLEKWNRTYNLTAVRDRQTMVTHHILDSLAVLPMLEGTVPSGGHYALADAGSGAGLPGLVIAIARPQWTVTSIEAADKKAAFQRQAKIEIGLPNVMVCPVRVETIRERYDAVISRAFASLAEFLRLAGGIADRLWAMKGDYPSAEIAALPPGWHVGASHALTIPGLDARRHLILLEKD